MSHGRSRGLPAAVLAAVSLTAAGCTASASGPPPTATAWPTRADVGACRLLRPVQAHTLFAATSVTAVGRVAPSGDAQSCVWFRGDPGRDGRPVLSLLVSCGAAADGLRRSMRQAAPAEPGGRVLVGGPTAALYYVDLDDGCVAAAGPIAEGVDLVAVMTTVYANRALRTG